MTALTTLKNAAKSFRGPLTAFALVLCSSALAHAGDITVKNTKGTLVIEGGNGRENITVFFNLDKNRSLFVTVKNFTGKVNRSGGTTGVEDFPLAGITAIKVSLKGDNDNLNFEHGKYGTRELKNWNGDLDLDFGSRSNKTSNHENLVIRGPLLLREITVKGDHSKRNDTIDRNVYYRRFRKL